MISSHRGMCSRFCLLFATLALTATSYGASQSPVAVAPLKQYDNAVLASEMAKELNQNSFSSKLKTALIESARPEDIVALKALIARYKKSKTLEVYPVFGRLDIVNRQRQVVFSVAVDPANSKRFAINGREWNVPDSGSILASLDRQVFDIDFKGAHREKTSPKISLFIPDAFAADSTAGVRDVARATTYTFISAHIERSGETAARYLAKQDVRSALLHGDGFPNGRSKLDAWLSFWGPKNVSCTPEGAKGFALISGTEVEFLAKADATLIVKSKGHTQSIAFIPNAVSLTPQAAEAREALAAIVAGNSGSDSEEVRVTKARNAMARISHLCYVVPEVDSEFCEIADLFADRYSRRSLTKRGISSLGTEPFMKVKESYIREQYLKEVVPWLLQNRDRALAFFEKSKNFVTIRDQTGTIEACLNDDCSKTLAGDSGSPGHYRIPPNNIEKSVTAALAFKPTSSPLSKATIEFNCPTKNHACKLVALTDESGLSEKDFLRAKELVGAANRSLSWAKGDPSVSQPVSTLRALGPCCEDSDCRAAVINKGVNLIPTKGTKPKGVAQ